jgi:hypothetical protein
MTAEIAIANRTALALAADSAVTIRVGNKTKIYDSAEKIFELSRKQPIGLMIYNNVEFVNVPLDVVIRKFRDEDAKIYVGIAPAADHFLKYIEKFSRDGIDEMSHLYPLLFERFRALQSKTLKTLQGDVTSILETLNSLVAQMKAGQAINVPGIDVSPATIFDKHLNEEIQKENARPLQGFLEDITLEMFAERYGDVVDMAIRRSINMPVDMNEERKSKLREYALSLVKRRRIQ